MSLDKMELSLRTQEKKPESFELKLINEQMAVAIKKEDFEQAAALRDFLNSQIDKNGEIELNKKDFIKPTKGGVYVYRKEEPIHRAWQGISNRRQEAYYAGKEKVEKSEFYEDLVFCPHTNGVLTDEEWGEIRSMRDMKGAKKIDFVLDFKYKRDEMKSMVDLAEEKFNSIWKPYCKKVGWSGPEYEEFQSFYGNNELTDEKLDAMHSIPNTIQDPLRYWQTVYDNSRIILDELNKALDTLNS